MLKYRFSVSFFITLFLYSALVFYFLYIHTIQIATVSKPQEKILSFSLSSYEPEPITEEIIEPEPIVEPSPEPPEEPEPIVEEVEPEPLPEPIVQKVVPKPLPVVKKKKIVKKKVIKKKPVKKKVKKKTSKKKVHKKRVSQKRSKHTSKKLAHKSSRAQASPAKKNAFLNKIRTRINRAKAYPRIAQRRGMQGVVRAKFTILPNGQVSNIRLSGAKVFYKSARNAIQKAFPISVKNIPLSLPTTVSVALRYQLR